MKTLNNYILIADSDKEYDEYVDDSLGDACDVSFYLNLLNTKSSKLLLEIIDFNMEFFDSKNICINYKEIKKALGLVGIFVKLIDKNKSFEENNIAINTSAITLSNEDASKKAMGIHNMIFKSILDIKGTKITY